MLGILIHDQQELIKYTAPDYPDYNNLKDALSKLQVEVDAINQNKAGADNLKKMINIHDRIDGLKVAINLFTPHTM